MKSFSFIIASGLWLGSGLLASQAQNFGLDAQSTGRAGAVTAESESAYSALFNPALLPTQSRPSFSFSTSQTRVNYKSFSSVLLPRSQRRTDEPSYGDYQLPAVDQTRWSLGFTYPLPLKALARKGGFGFAFSGPYEKLRGFAAHAPDDFFAVRYGAADSQLKGTVSVGLELIPETLFVGAGTSLSLSGAGTAETVLSDNPTSRMNLDVALESSPVLGVYSRLGNSSLGLAYHEKINPRLEQAMNARIKLNGRDSFYQPLLMRSSLYFEPRSLECDFQHDFAPVKVSAGVSYQFWTEYEAPVLFTETSDSLGELRQTQGGKVAAQNTLNPRASLTFAFNSLTTASLGYQYRPTPIKSAQQSSNAVDSDTHLLGLSLQHRFDQAWLLESPLTVGLFGQVHRMSNRQITQSGPNAERSRSFDFSGNAFVIGVSGKADL